MSSSRMSSSLLTSSLGLVMAETARVTSISNNRIGLGGGMITINGEGFATDAFSQFDPSKGNKVGESYTC